MLNHSFSFCKMYLLSGKSLCFSTITVIWHATSLIREVCSRDTSHSQSLGKNDHFFLRISYFLFSFELFQFYIKAIFLPNFELINLAAFNLDINQRQYVYMAFLTLLLLIFKEKKKLSEFYVSKIFTLLFQLLLFNFKATALRKKCRIRNVMV